MKTIPVCLTLLSLSAPMLLAQGRGHGNGGGPGPRDGAAMSPPGISRGAVDRAAENAKPNREEKPVRLDPAPARSAAPAAQELSGTMHSINQAAFAQRREVLSGVDMRLRSSHETMKRIQADAKAARADARADFKAALDDVKAREKDLSAAAKAVERVDEAGWELRRSALATAVQRHDAAIAKLEAIRFSP